MERIRRFIRELSEQRWLEQMELRWEITRAYYKLPGEYEELAPYPEGEGLASFPSKQGTTYFFNAKPDIPAGWQAEPFGLVFESGGEGLLRVNGISYQGLDRNHTYVTLDPAQIGPEPELEIELFDPVPEPVDPLNQQAVINPPITSVASLLVRPNRAVLGLMYTVTIVRDSAVLLPKEDFRAVRMAEALHAAMDKFVSLDSAAIGEGTAIIEIEQALKEAVRKIGGNAEGLEHMVGQSHIDIAWLWPVRETVRKASRTFSTVDRLMEEYPGYLYAQSQPQLFAFLKDNDPELFERVKARVAEGRWELVGGMWVEPDLNLPSGESLIRQMLYGQRFYREEFGKTSNIEWLPDTFGYCASLPQILKHGKIDYFMTTKLGWNDTNLFPYDLFYWVGIDGTPVLSYLNHGVNENTLPKDIHDHWQSFREKALHNEQMLLYGHGDGGGGVTREMLEYIDRSELMVGQPASRYSTAAQFFDGIAKAAPVLPKWRGDLYLELHRGTYTTHARNKRNNRKAEVLYREAELWTTLSAADMDASQREEAQRKLHEGWKLILLNQFHDIIPGSAIPEAYETSEKEYARIFEHGQAGLQTGLQALAGAIDTTAQAEGALAAYAVFNSLGWKRGIVVRLETDRLATASNLSGGLSVYDETGARLDVDRTENGLSVYVPAVPAFGYKTVWLKAEAPETANAQEEKATQAGQAGQEGTAVLEGAAANARQQAFEDTWETEFYVVRFNGRGEIASLFDKTAGREIVKPGEIANRFHFFHDRPTLWDAWDIDPRYEQQPAGEAELLEKRLVLAGSTKDVLRFRWKIGHSEITQDVIFYRRNRRIDFKTHVSWNEAHKLLKVGFPIDVVTEKATYEIPFGALERATHRNTSWEQAQFEVCGHRFADVSEHGYGVSLLNDCKYGYDVQGSTIRLSLLRAPKWPDVGADLGEHDFTYSLLPHTGDWREAHTVRHAADLNIDAPVLKLEAGQTGTRPALGSLIGLQTSHVVLDTVKPAEDGGVVLRFYESAGGRENVGLTLPVTTGLAGAGEAYVSNALEEAVEPLQIAEGRLSLSFEPYEIKTVLLK